MDFNQIATMGIVAGLVALIQTVKIILSANKIEYDGYVWLSITTICGFIMGFVVSAGEGFNLWVALGKSVIYAGSASLLYQHIVKPVIDAAVPKVDAPIAPEADPPATPKAGL